MIDINFCRAIAGKTDLARDNWRETIDDLRNEAEKLGVVFSQSHPVFLLGHVYHHSPETREQYEEMMRRSIIASSVLGVKWAVLHRLTFSRNSLKIIAWKCSWTVSGRP